MRTSQHSAFAVVTLLVALSACRQQQAASTADSAAPLVPPQRQLALAFELADIAINRETGQLALSNATDDQVQVRSWDASPALVVGRRGDGPCEFRNLVSVVWTDDSTLAVADGHTGRIQICSPGTPGGRTILIPGSVLKLQQTEDGGVVSIGSGGIDSLLALKFSAGDTSAVPRLDTLLATSNSSLDSMLSGNNRRSSVYLSPAGIAYVGSNDTAISIVSIVGREARIFAQESSPAVQLSTDEMNASDEEIRRFLARTGRPLPPRNPATKGAARSPAFKPAFKGRALATDSLARLWALPAYPDSLGASLLVYDAIGKRVGSFRLGVPITGFLVQGDHLVGFWNDAEGRGHLAEWRIGGAPDKPVLN